MSKVSTVNLEHGLPTAKAALQHLEGEVQGAKVRGAALLRVIHGYGSSGKGGKIRNALRNALPGMKTAGLIKDYLPGDAYDEFNIVAHELRDRFPALNKTFHDDRGNPGVTFILL